MTDAGIAGLVGMIVGIFVVYVLGRMWWDARGRR